MQEKQSDSSCTAPDNGKMREITNGEHKRTRFFSRSDRLAFWTGFAVSFAVYFMTAAPSVTLEDSGELAVAGDHLGVPHPPGYPIWTIFAWIFARILGFVTFRGQPDPAWAIAVMSGFFGALAVGITAMLIKRTSFDMIQAAFFRKSEPLIPSEADIRSRIPLLRTICFCAGVSGALVFGFSPVMWSQCTIVEVYSLNAFFLMLIFLFTYMWMKNPSAKYLWMTGFLFGLGFTNYQVLLFAAVPLVIAVLLINTPLFRDFVLAGIPFCITVGIMKLGAMPSMPGFEKIQMIPAEGSVPAFALSTMQQLTWYYAAAAVFASAAVVSFAYLGIQAARNKNSGPDRKTAGIVAAVALLALLKTLVSIPDAAALTAAAVPPGVESFSWIMPVAVLIIALAALFVFAYFIPGGIWYAGAVSTILITMGALLAKGVLPGLTHPLSPFFSLYVFLNFVYLLLAWLMLPNGQTVSIAVFLTELGVAFYGYMPIASDTNPPMNWGYSRTWEGFKHAVSRGQYEKIVPVSLQQLLSPVFVKQIADYFTDLRAQFTLLLAPIGFIPFTVWRARIGKRTFNMFPIAAAMAFLVAAAAVLERTIDPGTSNNLGSFYKGPMALILTLAGIGFTIMIIYEGKEIFSKAIDKGASLSDRIVNAVCLIGLVTFVLACIGGVSVIISEYILDAVYHIPEPAPGMENPEYLIRSALLAAFAFIVLSALFGAAVWWCRGSRPVFEVQLDSVSRKWIITTMAGFLMMSVVLIAMAKPKGDIQDNFIQKVKFIASHGFFAIWIGYGMAYSLAAFIRSRAVCIAGCSAALLLAAVPVYENYFNYDLADIVSSAEQNGHDFGWQFGNYQLRGAGAINEELSPDEEPLPNPYYPPEMEQNAVFFGGTDPGRFVPTYMIFSADVRPDVFLITQNALADNTYMNTMRDMYGDMIWMPTSSDNSAAFDKYVRDVREGKLPNLGGIVIDPSGRIQVNGAQEVMEINAILTKDIFDHNIANHAFYVEESYAIRWMYPYLTPHGLIMKINAAPTSISKSNTIDDMDFWDWYTRRLTSNKKFGRDVPARKAFSKLRVSLSGLYAQRGDMKNAERAFNESLLLYPYSPESNMRLIREVLLPMGRVEEAVLLLEKFVTKDKNNTAVPPVLESLREMEIAKKYIDSVPRNLDLAAITDDEILKLIHAYSVVNNISKVYEIASKTLVAREDPSVSLIDGIAVNLRNVGLIAEASLVYSAIPYSTYDDQENITPEMLVRMADSFMASQDSQKALYAVKALLRRDPKNWKAWLEFSKLSYTLGKINESAVAMRDAIRIGGTEAERLISSNQELYRIYQFLFKAAENSPQPRPQAIPAGR